MEKQKPNQIDNMATIRSSEDKNNSLLHASPFFQVGNLPIGDPIADDSSAFLIDKTLTGSPPKLKKNSSLSDIVAKLKAGAGGSDSGNCAGPVSGSVIQSVPGVELKKDPDKQMDYTIKPLEGLKLTINKSTSKSKDFFGSDEEGLSFSSSSISKLTKSGLKPGVSGGPASRKSNSSSPADLSAGEILLPDSKTNRSLKEDFSFFSLSNQYLKCGSISSVPTDKSKDERALHKSKSCEYVRGDVKKLGTKSLSQRSADAEFLAPKDAAQVGGMLGAEFLATPDGPVGFGVPF